MIEETFREVKKAFPDVKAKMSPARISSFMVSRPFGARILYSKEQLKRYNFSNTALKGVIAHELAHKVQAKKAHFMEKLLVLFFQRFKYVRKLLILCRSDKNKDIERDADKIAVERGFGDELIRFIKETRIRFDKNRILKIKANHLSVREIVNLMSEKKCLKFSFTGTI